MRILVWGSGAWGTALGVHAAARHPVFLLARDPVVAAQVQASRCNAQYLPGVTLPPTLRVGADRHEALQWLREGATAGHTALILVATPVAGLRQAITQIAAHGRSEPWVVLWLCKGLERETGLLPHQVVAEALGSGESGHDQPALGVLSGPSFAQEVAAGLPAALTVACRDPRAARAALEGLHHGALRIYRGLDVVGVEIGGALKNIMAIAAGLCDGLSLGQNARAALITRGLAEMARFGAAQGARQETFMGLAGLGDLVLTCTGDLSRNRRVGLALARGSSLADVLQGLGHVAEGVACCRVVSDRARALGVDVPIVHAVRALLDGAVQPAEALRRLLAREPKDEL